MRPEPGRAVLVRFRPTWRQAAARGLYAGGWGAVVGAALIFALPEAAPPLAPLPPLVCLLLGIAVARRSGVDVDEHGIRPQVPWKRVVDIRAERRRGRTVAVVYLDTGATLRLRAPYDGRWLARDPLFERRFFTLIHLWETHRDWGVHG